MFSAAWTGKVLCQHKGGNGGEQVGIEGTKMSVCACKCVCLWMRMAGCPWEYYNISVTPSDPHAEVTKHVGIQPASKRIVGSI